MRVILGENGRIVHCASEVTENVGRKHDEYDSAIRADMTICDTEFEGPAPFYKQDSNIVKRQYVLHHGQTEIL